MLAVSLLGLDIAPETVVIGALSGLAYAALGAGLVLVFRATRVVNFAYGELGAFGAALLAKLVLDYDWNFFVALGLVVLVGGCLGLAIELMIIRRLFDAPRLVLLVATIGVAQVLYVAQLLLPDIERIARYPSPLDRGLQVGDFLVRSEHFMILAFVPAIVATLAVFLTYTPYGIAIRASAENPDAARLAGISTKRVSTAVWVLSGVLATVTIVLVNPVRGAVVGTAVGSAALGPGLLLRALTAALVGRLVSLPLTLVGGLLVGIVEAVVLADVNNPGVPDMLFFVAVLGLVLFRGADTGAGDQSGWTLSPPPRPMIARLRKHPIMVRMRRRAIGASIAVAVLLPLLFPTSERAFLFSRVALFALIGLSVTVLTGWSGQLSLGQFAFVGLGAFVTVGLVDRGMGFLPAVGFAALAGALAALAIGAPALRVQGLLLAITTLAFAIGARGYLFPHSLFTGQAGGTVDLPRAALGPFDLRSNRTYYYLCLVVLVVVGAAIARLRTTGVGRTLLAVRDNEAAAAAFSVSPTVAKLTAFGLSGAIAAVAGALMGGLHVQFNADLFGPEQSLRVVAMTIIGGLGSVTGAVLGAVYVVGLPALFGNRVEVTLLTSGIGLLILLLYLPGGLVSVIESGRRLLLLRMAKRLDVNALAARALAALPPPVTQLRPRRPVGADGDSDADQDAAPLDVTDVTVRFGGRTALDGVSIVARQGEVVGLIGANGAGKSTLMNVVSGFITPASGRVALFGEDVTDLRPEERAAAGLGRVFQDARLFGSLTVAEAVSVALERGERTELVPSLLGLPPARRSERRKATETDELIGFLGLGRYRDVTAGRLSTGTRRIVELACQLALAPRVILLDEPTAGVAQRETEAFGPLIARIKDELGATVVIIEHDMPLVMAMSDRVYCLDAGAVIAEGVPHAVRDNPAVVAAYLGTDERAIRRSGAAADSAVGATSGNVNGATDLSALTRKELLDLAAARGVPRRSGMAKAELIEALGALHG